MFRPQWCTAVIWCCSLMFTSAATSAEKLRFVLYYPQVPPYMYQEPGGKQVVGLVPELLNAYFKNEQVQVEFVIDNRRGAEHRLYSGDVDAMLVAPEWTEHPEQLVFSDALLQHKDYLFALRPFAKNSQVRDWLIDKSVCTRQYYVYQALEPFFKRDGTRRIDASSELAQMKMLRSGRCDYAYMNEHVALWLQQHQLANIQLYQSPIAFGEVALRVAFHPKWQPYLAGFNQYLEQQRQHGTIQEKLNFYIQKQ